jgi:starvation-inducible DNA-binding protein
MKATMETMTDLGSTAVAEISDSLRQLLADVFALCLKTKNFHWHIGAGSAASGSV